MAFPRKEAEIKALLDLWKERMPDHAARYGITGDMLKQVDTDAIIYGFNILCRDLLNQDVEELSAYRENANNGNPEVPAADFPTITLPAMPALLTPPKQGIISRNTLLYNYLKGHPNRTAESLADLGITDAPNNAAPPESKKPTISGNAVTDDRVSLTFNKQGMKAVRIQMRRNGGDWTIVADPTSSPFIDTTQSVDGKPEKREYRAIYLEKNQPVGQYSDIITVYTTP